MLACGFLHYWIRYKRKSNHGLDGIIVYADEPEGTSIYSAGWNNKDDKVEADPETLFKIASISKLYIAVAAAEDVGIFLRSLNDGTLVNKKDFMATQYIGCTGHNNLPMLKAFQNNGCTVIERNKVFKRENKNLFRV
ncbi:serine hydrolase [Mesobacillus jeotgali]|uniref:serine hydrolase n=1 Tax=Mesobacillus jeotgali TaxID=129985 RepID=UPI000C85E8BA|nr:serine hydrolase [Mesobacillus jeotgali]